MEGVLTILLQSGNIFAIACFIICYLVIYFQRKSTSSKRNEFERKTNKELEIAKAKVDAAEAEAQTKIKQTQEEMEDKLNHLNTEKLLMQKDIEMLKNENIGIKADVKEIKNTLNTMAMALERIAAAYDIKIGKGQ